MRKLACKNNFKWTKILGIFGVVAGAVSASNRTINFPTELIAMGCHI